MRIISKLVPLFIVVPLIELALLIQIGRWIGIGETIGLCLVTGVIGAYLVQFEGLKIWVRLQSELSQLRLPTKEMIEGVLVLIGGILLLTPGVITDFVGLTLLLPLTRPFYRKWLERKYAKRIQYSRGDNNRQARKTATIIKVIDIPKNEEQNIK